MKQKSEITELDTQEVSIVDKGANLKKRFPLWKSEGVEKMELDEILQAVLSTPAENEDKFDARIAKAKLDEAAVNAAKGALRLLSGHKDKLPPDILRLLGEIAGYPMDEEKNTKQMDEDEESCPAPKKADKTAKAKKTEAVEEGVTKEADDAMTDALETLRKQNEEIEKQLKAERDLRLEAEWTKKAETELAHFPGKTSVELGKILKTLNDVDPKLAEEQFTAMKSASDMIKSSAILKSTGIVDHGVSDSNDESAMAQIQKFADGVVEKSADLTMTPEKAVAKLMKSAKGAKLYNDYLDEHPEQKHFAKPGAR